jgi:phosphatidylserine/phosphatidylglycerophosphate/cardiolipin synthase-like enzyme
MKKIILVVSLLVSSWAVAQPVAIESPQIGAVEIAFSPKGEAEELVLKLIRSARSDIQMMAYSYTSKPIISALLKAKRRGVRVAVAVDSSNITDKVAKSALSALIRTGVEVRTVTKMRIVHDRILIVDGKHLKFGSFNYAMAASAGNPENVTVFWDAPELAEVYFDHWQRRWRQGMTFTGT